MQGMRSSKEARTVLRVFDDLRVRQASSVVLQAFGWGSPEEAAKRHKAEDAKQKDFNKQRAKVGNQLPDLSSPNLQLADACGLASCTAADRKLSSALAPCLVIDECVPALSGCSAPAPPCNSHTCSACPALQPSHM